MNTLLSPDERAAQLLAQMTLEEKVDMLCKKLGPDLPSRDLGMPVLTITDGPVGIRIDREKRYVDEGKATSLPAPIALAATWDIATAEQYGDLLGQEAWSTGHNVLFGPQLDIARIPVFGRLLEACREDPVLTGQIATRYIQGVQRHHVIATAKHYNVNAQEGNRYVVDAQLDERTLQEIYTLPFAVVVVVQDGQVSAVMGAYNKINGTTAASTRAVQVRFTVTNTGARAGAEIAQVYLGLPASTGEPLERLAGWAKVEVEPGETREVTVTLDPNATSRPLSYWDVTTSGWQRAGGDYTVYMGASSRGIHLTGTMHIHDAEEKDSGKQAN